MRVKRFRWLAVVLVWVVIIGVLLEGGLRLAAPVLPGNLGVTARWVVSGRPFAQDWTPGWQENIDHYYALKPGLDHVLQFGSPTVSFHLSTIELWDGGGIGFRTRPVDYFVDAVVVGDSFGMCFTELADCWVTILEKDSGMGMVNLSQPVTGSTSHERILQDFGKPLTPPLTIWQFFGNDFNDDYGLAVYRHEIAEMPDDKDLPPLSPDDSLLGWLRTRSAAVAVLEMALTGQWRGLPENERLFIKPYQVTYGDNVLDFGELYEQEALDMSRPRNQKGLELSREAFEKAQALVQEWDGKLVAMIIPTREEVYSALTTPYMGESAIHTLSSAREAMLSVCGDLNLICLDLLPAFQEHAAQNEALYYADDMHLNPHGNLVMAETVNTWLDEQGLVPEK